MDGSTVAIDLRETYRSFQWVESRAGQCGWFATIPPERIGLDGEFDYDGLSKRVSHYLRTQTEHSLNCLKVRQRGRVVVLSGQVRSDYLLRQVTHLAMAVDGVDAVETTGLVVIEAG